MRRLLSGLIAVLALVVSSQAFAAYAYVNQADNSNAASAPNIQVTYSTTAHNAVIAFTQTVAAGSITTDTFADNKSDNCANVFRLYNATWGGQLDAWICKNVAGGSTQFTYTPPSSESYQGILVVEYSGISAATPYVSGEYAAQFQPSVGTGANGVSAGNTPTLSGQPDALIAVAQDITATSPPNAGIGFTGHTSFWTFGTTNHGALEDERLTSTSPVAATFTSTGTAGDNFIVGGVVLHEGSSGSGPCPCLMLFGDVLSPIVPLAPLAQTLLRRTNQTDAPINSLIQGIRQSGLRAGRPPIG